MDNLLIDDQMLQARFSLQNSDVRFYKRVKASIQQDRQVTYKLVDANGYVVPGSTGIFTP